MENLGASGELSSPLGRDNKVWGDAQGRSSSPFAQERSRLRASGGGSGGLRRSRSFNPGPAGQVSRLRPPSIFNGMCAAGSAACAGHAALTPG